MKAYAEIQSISGKYYKCKKIRITKKHSLLL